MKTNDKIKKRMDIAEKRILELIKSDDLKKLSEEESHYISKFYEEKSRNRLETARIIYDASRGASYTGVSKGYKDYAEAVAAAYYSMYYIVHSFLALKYKQKLREDVRGVHAITEYVILYYLVKTGKLARQLYKKYLQLFETAVQVQKISPEDFQEKAYNYAKKYDKTRTARETFTYNITSNIEAYHAQEAINTAEEFNNTIRQIMLSR